MARRLSHPTKDASAAPGSRHAARSTRFRPRLDSLEDRLLLSPYVVTNVNDSGPGSLREGLLEHASPITFDIGSGLQIIRPLSPLPTIITAGRVIDGTTQPGYSGTPLIVIDGTSAGSSANGFVLTGGSCTIKGLVIDNFTGPRQAGILIQLHGQNLITDNYIGTDPTGTQARGNTYGVFVDVNNNYNNRDNAVSGNLISGNGSGVEVYGVYTQVVGNRIGTNAAGTQAIPNGYGVYLYQSLAFYNVIGGTTAADRNLISGNYTGVYADGGFNEILGNYIGTDAAGTAAVGNGTGIYTTDGSNTVGGTAPGAGNVISGNGDGLYLYGAMLVEGNFIGLNAVGTAALPNYNGIEVYAVRVTIGGAVPGAGNVISGNLGDGILGEAGGGRADPRQLHRHQSGRDRRHAER